MFQVNIPASFTLPTTGYAFGQEISTKNWTQSHVHTLIHLGLNYLLDPAAEKEFKAREALRKAEAATQAKIVALSNGQF